MGSGLQIFNKKGNVIFDVNDLSYVIYGYGDTERKDGEIFNELIDENTAIVVYDDGVTDIPLKKGDLFYTSAGTGEAGAHPLFKIEKGKISWKYNQNMINVYKAKRYRFLYIGRPK